MRDAILPIVSVALFLTSAIREAGPEARSAAQLAATVRRAGWLGPAWWLLRLSIGLPVVAVWCATRIGVYLLAYAAARVCAALATLTAMDGRGLRLCRADGGRA